jgi:plasmid stabilization system protein ParE
MPRKYTVKWTPKASDTLESVLKSVLLNWGYDIAKKADKEIENFLVLLENNNKLCPPSKVKNVRRCVISKHTSLAYRVKGSFIELVAFVNNSSNHKY